MKAENMKAFVLENSFQANRRENRTKNNMAFKM